MPAKLPTEDSASERWCQASAIRALESMRRAAARVYQNMASFTTMDTTAAARARAPGETRSSPPTILRMPVMPMPTPVAPRMRPRISAATHSNRSWP